jgi:hypothetical protein
MAKLFLAAIILFSLWLWTFLPPDIKKMPEIVREYGTYRVMGH